MSKESLIKKGKIYLKKKYAGYTDRQLLEMIAWNSTLIFLGVATLAFLAVVLKFFV